jgi:ABC transport system ATP-binding/permease protein
MKFSPVCRGSKRTSDPVDLALASFKKREMWLKGFDLSPWFKVAWKLKFTLSAASPPRKEKNHRPKVTLDDTTLTGTILLKGQSVETILLEAEVVLGRDTKVTVQLNDPAVSRQHAIIKKRATGYRITDLESRSGLFVNGCRRFVHDLVIGDQVQIGPFHFLFDGRHLVRLHRLSLGRLIALDLEKRATSGPILEKLSFVAESGQFIGILGPSGAGKSTLLNALSGLRPPDSGRILIDGIDYYQNFDVLRSRIGHVPQDDLVHSELTVIEAFTFSARLRLPAGTSVSEIEVLVEDTIARLGLNDRSHFRISQLSGGQRKRINVGIELLNRPLLLFLDEPTSGLDPFSEFKMMELLRKLANTGCTVVCTTHVVENVFLMDQIAVMMKGRLVFQGAPDSVCATFGVARFSELYAALQGVAPENLPFALSPLSLGPDDTKESKGFPARRRSSFSLPILMQRQTALFRADLKNIIIALGQPLMIGAVVIAVTQEPPLAQFFAYIGTLWFGCSNSAQEIIRELSIYRRERLVGLSRCSYLLSKLLWMGSLTALQALVLFAVVSFGEVGNKGDLWLQIAGLIFLAYAATGIGLTLSTLARSAIQAVMLVPMVLIPQILFSGHTVEVRNMSESVRRVSELMPSFCAERIEDISFFLNQKIAADEMAGFLIPYHNVNEVYRRLGYKVLESGKTIEKSRPLWPLCLAFLTLTAWLMAGFCASYFLLARKERQ